MRKFILTAFAGLAIVGLTPQLVSAVPLARAALGAAADNVSTTEQVHHRWWHHRGRHWRRHHHHRRHHHRHWR
jgi:hypothetical protein